MSGAYSNTVERPEPVDLALRSSHAWIRGAKWLAILLVLVWLVSLLISVFIRHSVFERKFTAHLEAAFGRPVHVGSYNFSFWGGPSLEAQSVTVAEDPRFGHEYFLYADSLSVHLSWISLLRGQIELGTLSLSHPSLNLVRDSSGEWNLAEWLPRPAENAFSVAPVGPSLPSLPLRFRRIEIDGGRVNFKQGDAKLPLAFTGVSGSVETDGPGRWRIDLDATPWRAAVLLQQVGTIHVSGHVGGTSSRLRPAAFDLAWTDASIPDVIRLAFGDDYGIRGALALTVDARTDESDGTWAFQGNALLTGLHRWDLASRSDNPSLSIVSRARWNPAASLLEFTGARIESPHSSLHANARLAWSSSRMPSKERGAPAVQVVVTPSEIAFSDLLDWLRAFRSDVAEAVSAQGTLMLTGQAFGRPLRIVNATAFSSGVDLAGASLRTPAHLARVELRYDRGVVSLPPATLTFAAVADRAATSRSLKAPAVSQAGSFQISLSTTGRHRALPAWRVAGSSRDVRDLVSAAEALGWNISRGWDLAGPVACDLLWNTNPPWRVAPTGWIEFGAESPTLGASSVGSALHAPFLNLPIDQIRARADLKPGRQHIALASARAFGAEWSGTFDRSDADPEWQFVLATDTLASSELDRWLNPLWRESFLDRLLPFLSPPVPETAVPESLRAQGRLTLSEFALPPLSVRHLQANLNLDGRHVELTGATGQFYGGTLAGSLDANLETSPSYSASVAFSRVDLSALSAASAGLANLFGGSATGNISLSATGATRGDLLGSLWCRGQSEFLNPVYRGIDLLASLRLSSSVPGVSRFSRASVSFTCSNEVVRVAALSIAAPGPDIGGSGAVDFRRDLDLRLSFQAPGSQSAEAAYRLTGTLDSARIARVPAPQRSR